jgi:hypothetical protein
VSSTAFSIAGYALTWSGVASIIATIQLLAFAAWSGTSRSKFAKSGLRACDRALLASGIVFLATWAVAFDARAFVREAMTPTATTQASITGTTEVRASCASLQNGMTAAQMRKKVGRPDQVIAEDDVRGPGAEVWVYTDRCNAHVFEGKLEFVE